MPELALDIVTIDRVMTSDVECVEASQPLAQVVERLCDERISCIVVCEKQEPIGIITERDLVVVLHEVLRGESPPETAGALMSSPVVTIQESATVHETMLLFEERGVRRLVVVDGAGAFSGLVTQSDMLRAHAWDLDVAQQTIRQLTKRGREAG